MSVSKLSAKKMIGTRRCIALDLYYQYLDGHLNPYIYKSHCSYCPLCYEFDVSYDVLNEKKPKLCEEHEKKTNVDQLSIRIIFQILKIFYGFHPRIEYIGYSKDIGKDYFVEMRNMLGSFQEEDTPGEPNTSGSDFFVSSDTTDYDVSSSDSEGGTRSHKIWVKKVEKKTQKKCLRKTQKRQKLKKEWAKKMTNKRLAEFKPLKDIKAKKINEIIKSKKLIIGNVGSGKSTTTALIQSKTSCKNEDTFKWNLKSSGNFLDHLKSESSYQAINMQMFLAIDMLACDDDIQESGILAVMYHTFTKFMKKIITLQQLFQFMQSISSIDLNQFQVLYLNTEPVVCQERIIVRNKGYDSYLTVPDLYMNFLAIQMGLQFHHQLKPVTEFKNNNYPIEKLLDWIES